MLRFPPMPLVCSAAYGGPPTVVVDGDTAAAVVLACCVADGKDSFESEARRRCEISTLTVLKVTAVKADDFATAVERNGMLKLEACSLREVLLELAFPLEYRCEPLWWSTIG